MKIERTTWTKDEGWAGGAEGAGASWVLYFASPELSGPELYEAIRERYPDAIVQGCSTGGEIAGEDVHDGIASVVAITLERTQVRGERLEVASTDASFATGSALGTALAAPDLRALFVLSDGTKVNGTELTRGLQRAVGDKVVVSGGLAGDGARFGATRVGLDAPATPGVVAAIGLYGDALVVRCGTAGGWSPFGPQRLVTKSIGNVLYELDGKPALDLYKKYLGEEAQKLPASALLYPLMMQRANDDEEPVVRTIVGVDEEANTMTFAGDIPEGATAQLMRASIDELVDGASSAAKAAQLEEESGFAVLVSCIGRKLLMGQRTADEVEAVSYTLGETYPTVGFYSYGEIAPGTTAGFSDLHNQTMTITTFAEKAA